GQNLIEAGAAGTPVIVGPHPFNFKDAARAAMAAGAALRAPDARPALDWALQLLAEPARRQAMSQAAPPDQTLRAVLARWARAAGWTFEPEHWTLDVDIPLAGRAELPGDFKAAVRALLATTELSERPAQPCFYANRVLRVVPLAQACDRTRATVPGLT
ncbi:toxin co-regulated pilus biosynthesis protein Q, partial [Bordetella bronchiseptica E012]|uniref:toxin co-regulated pilus biosynthesis Q family protein n=1 Tax=Bordetella bronchiseptica TaxID=518 RepID=UPI000461C2B3